MCIEIRFQDFVCENEYQMLEAVFTREENSQLTEQIERLLASSRLIIYKNQIQVRNWK